MVACPWRAGRLGRLVEVCWVWRLTRMRLCGTVGTGAGRTLSIGVGLTGLGGSLLRTLKLLVDAKRTILLVVLASAHHWF